ncbi:sulfur oxidation c-type cytochrome SoxA [Thiohalobacter thiocyanaticus]|uniref:SoxAX cytochrome complex subunit A n=1 Tax=Thiohalobacter thiocyanaticus TaxID=585455 RepID=A0A426QHC5_9GAMM|nr:sulfur oxidation c-type cytochrome SoxA [Thiohalobacter thiocyanaticus]RRQ21157.1 sulfur oxidation c-type cytochrome SoxA [Thiohalobacter thiocyanaticus]
MRKILAAVAAAGMVAALPQAANATPQEDLKEFRAYFDKRFPNVPFDDYVNGVYSIDQASREQWESIEDFPPYEIDISAGKEMFNTPFKNGKTYASCFENDGKGVRQNYPYFDTKTGEVVTLEGAINACRVKNGEEPLGWKKGKIAQISAYMAYTSRGNEINIEVPNDERAQEAYERGKAHFYAKRGQLNMACADCHVYNAGNKVRADLLSPALGHVTHFPVYRSKWGELGTLHRRYGGCNKQVRAKPFPAQSDEYKALEYFHTYMSNGLEVNGPGARK